MGYRPNMSGGGGYGGGGYGGGGYQPMDIHNTPGYGMGWGMPGLGDLNQQRYQQRYKKKGQKGNYMYQAPQGGNLPYQQYQSPYAFGY